MVAAFIGGKTGRTLLSLMRVKFLVCDRNTNKHKQILANLWTILLRKVKTNNEKCGFHTQNMNKK